MCRHLTHNFGPECCPKTGIMNCDLELLIFLETIDYKDLTRYT